MLKIENIIFRFDDNLLSEQIIDDISINISPKSILVVMGPSGCGKTTFLNLLASLLPLSSGSISYPNNQNSVGYVFQNPSLMPWQTVLQNALSGAKITKNIDGQLLQKASDLMQAYGLKGYENKYPKSLSGGMQQRVALIRAVLAGASILLLDEPFSNSDYQMRRSLQSDLSDLVDEEEVIAIMVTHDINEAVRLGDKIVIMTPSPSQIGMTLEISIPRKERLSDRHDKELFSYEEKIKEFLNQQIRS